MRKVSFILASVLTVLPVAAATVRYTIDTSCGPRFCDAVNRAIGNARAVGSDSLHLTILPGTYTLDPHAASRRVLHASNHDQTSAPQPVGIDLRGLKSVSISGCNTHFMCAGPMIAVAVDSCSDVSLSGFTIDFAEPHTFQALVEEVNPYYGYMTVRPQLGGRPIERGRGVAFVVGRDTVTPLVANAYEPQTRRIAYDTADLPVDFAHAKLTLAGSVVMPLPSARIEEGMTLVLRDYSRPAPAILISDSHGVTLSNITVNYAEGMGLLAQNSSDITLSRFDVALPLASDRRFTTKADATHFSGCSGRITVTDCLFEQMLDDAINIHGTYLKVDSVKDADSPTARFMHPQTYGIGWAAPADSVSFINPLTMERVGQPLAVSSVSYPDERTVSLTFSAPIPENAAALAIENLTRTPEVEFARCTVRNNRARGALFSTPRTVNCHSNLFDHTSGAAILVCADCNGWFESGAVRDVRITDCTFINPLTSRYQFTEAAISVCPVIPRPDLRTSPLHRGVTVTGCRFNTFGSPLLFTDSTADVVWSDNTVTRNIDYLPMPDRRPDVTILPFDNVNGKKH